MPQSLFCFGVLTRCQPSLKLYFLHDSNLLHAWPLSGRKMFYTQTIHKNSCIPWKTNTSTCANPCILSKNQWKSTHQQNLTPSYKEHTWTMFSACFNLWDTPKEKKQARCPKAKVRHTLLKRDGEWIQRRFFAATLRCTREGRGIHVRFTKGVSSFQGWN